VALFFQQIINGSFQFPAFQIAGNYFSFLINQVIGRNLFNFPLVGYRCVPSTGFIYLQPLNLIGGYSPLPVADLIIDTDAVNLKSFLFKRRINIYQVLIGPSAGATPTGPKSINTTLPFKEERLTGLPFTSFRVISGDKVPTAGWADAVTEMNIADIYNSFFI